MTDPIATRKFTCISPDGKRFALTVQLGRPVPINDAPDSDWHCPVTIPFRRGVTHICGIDSWQALHLAVSFAHFQLAHFLQQGGKLYDPGTTDEFTLEDFPHAVGNLDE